MVDQKRFFLKASGHFWQEAAERALPQWTQFGNKQPRTNTIFFNHNGHKEISQRTLSVELTAFFLTFIIYMSKSM